MFCRLFWVALVTISLTAFSYYSVKTYVRWLENPIVLEIDEKLAEIYEIPFPTVRKSDIRFNRGKPTIK
jgi:hypothetical protein